MAESLLIRLDNSGALRDWAPVDEQGACPHGVQHGELDPQAASGRRVVVLVPAEDVHLCRARVPGQKRQRVLRAIPYALEEHLADDVEALHFAIGPAQADSHFPVAVVSRARMNGWLEALQDMGLAPDQLVPETLALPAGEADWSLLVDGTRVLVRSGPYSGFATDVDNLASVVDLFAGREQAPSRVRQWGAGGVTLGGVELEAAGGDPDEPVLAILARGWARSDTIDLQQGAYSRREALGRMLRPWRTSAALLLAGLLLAAASGGVNYYRLTQQQAQLTARIEQLYRQTFPDAKRIVNARAQMQQRLEQLERRAGTAGNDFIGLLGATADVLRRTGGIRISGVSYRDGRLDLELAADNLQVLDQLKQKLAASGRLQAEIQSATTEAGQKVKSRIRVQGVRS